MIAGLIGVPVGSFLAQRLRPRHESCDPYICAFGLLISAPMVYLSLVTPQTTTSFCFLFVFLAQVTLNLCWSIVADILLVRKMKMKMKIQSKSMNQCGRSAIISKCVKICNTKAKTIIKTPHHCLLLHTHTPSAQQ